LKDRSCRTCGKPLDERHTAYCSWECRIQGQEDINRDAESEDIENGKNTIRRAILRLKKQDVKKIYVRDFMKITGYSRVGTLFHHLSKLQEEGLIKLDLKRSRGDSKS